MNHIKYILLALICAVAIAPVAAKGVCTQSELDSVTEMSHLQERLFNAHKLTGVKVLLYLQPFHNETPIQRALIKSAMDNAAGKINAAFGAKVVTLVRDDVIAENLAIVIPVKYAPSGALAYQYPDVDWMSKMGYATPDAVLIASDTLTSNAENYEVERNEMLQFVIMHELAHHFQLEHWFEYGDKEDACLMGEVGKNSAPPACIPVDFCAAEKAAIRAAQ